jgi:hypothetical protein
MNRVLIRVAFFVVALALTLFVFNFWGDFGRAMYNYLNMTTAPEKPGNANNGVVMMKIIPPPNPPAENKPVCDKKHPCK